MTLTLFRLTRPDVKEGQWYKEARCFVIAAADEKSARGFAILHMTTDSCYCSHSEREFRPQEVPEKWLKEAICEVVGIAAEHIQPGIVVADHTGE